MRHAPAELNQFATTALKTVGVCATDAETTASLLVAADVRGRTGHGLIRLPSYVARMRAGGMATDAVLQVLHETPVSAQIDGHNGLGQVVMSRATDLAIHKAKISGLAWVGTTRSNHAGAAGLYVERAAEHGLVAIYLAVANANGMPPWGGTDPILGTNPLAIGVPRADGHPFVLDIATTNASHGTIKVAARDGVPMPEGWVVGADGEPITDPARADDGYLVPMGGYKGSGLTIAIGLLAGVMNGAAFGRDVIDHRADLTTPTNTGQSILVLRPDLFGDRDTILAELGRHFDEIRSSATTSGSPVRLPGDEAARVRRDNELTGVDVPKGLAHELDRLATDLDIPSPFGTQEHS